jgi:hypothetical protein
MEERTYNLLITFWAIMIGLLLTKTPVKNSKLFSFIVNLLRGIR